MERRYELSYQRKILGQTDNMALACMVARKLGIGAMVTEARDTTQPGRGLFYRVTEADMQQQLRQEAADPITVEQASARLNGSCASAWEAEDSEKLAVVANNHSNRSHLAEPELGWTYGQFLPELGEPLLEKMRHARRLKIHLERLRQEISSRVAAQWSADEIDRAKSSVEREYQRATGLPLRRPHRVC